MLNLPGINGRKETRLDRKQKGSGSSHIKESDTTFSDALHQTVTDNARRDLEDMLGNMRDQEQRFLNSQSQYDLMEYKKAVSSILSFILEEGYQTEALKKTRRRGNEMTIVRSINEHLAALAQEVTRGSHGFQLMKHFEEIRGLVLELIM